jgi:hypothetical protein
LIELYPPYKGTDKSTGFEIMVIALALVEDDRFGKAMYATCIGEEGELYFTSIDNVVVDWRYDRKVGAWMSINDPEPAKP